MKKFVPRADFFYKVRPMRKEDPLSATRSGTPVNRKDREIGMERLSTDEAGNR